MAQFLLFFPLLSLGLLSVLNLLLVQVPKSKALGSRIENNFTGENENFIRIHHHRPQDGHPQLLCEEVGGVGAVCLPWEALF